MPQFTKYLFLRKSLRGFITGQWHCPAWWKLPTFFFFVISLRNSVKIDVAEMYCFFQNLCTKKKNSSSTWRFSEDHCMFLWLFTFSVNLLTAHVWMCNHTQKKKTFPRKNSFRVYRQQEIYCIFKTCSHIPVLFSMKCHLFHNCAFFCSSNDNDFINHALEFKHTP